MTPDRWRRAQEVFVAATEREPGSRAAFLEETCRDDPELKSEVESLLSSYGAAPSGFLESPAIDGIPALPPMSRSLGKGTRLGPYEVLAPLGAGGMGEVYRASDSRLGRDVAIKVLPAELSSDASRVKRFEKEARSASALNHPNIVTIYDTGTSEGVAWIAMERVDGVTLRELVTGPIGIKKLLQIASQIADGLAKAHEAGIVHRDLKPENVMVTRDGLVKILDFGLAKLTSTGSGSGEGSKLPTMTGTTPGVIFGTVGYMSPEQAGGTEMDFRSDQFSFGSILYEMVTGQRAFQGKTAIDTLGTILNDEPPPIASVNPHAPTQLRWIVERCLAKEPRQRYSSTDDLARDLATLRDHLSEATSGGALALPAMEPRRRQLSLWIPILAGVLLASWAGIYLLGRNGAVHKPLTIKRLTFGRGRVFTARFAPDGQTVLYAAEWNGKPREIFQTRPESPESRSFGLKDLGLFAISSMGELAIQNLQAETLARMPLAGGAPKDVLEGVIFADWSPDGKELAIIKRAGLVGANRLEYPIGKLLYEAEDIHLARVSPDGRRVAFARHRALLVAEPGGKIRTLAAEAARVFGLAWSPKGDEVWFSVDNEVRAVSLSGRNRVLAGFLGRVILLDVSRVGRALLIRQTGRNQMVGKIGGTTKEQDYSWHDSSGAVDLSADGKTILFQEWGEGGAAEGGSSPVAYLRRTGEDQAIRLGEGAPMALSPDGKWALVEADGPPKPVKLALLPTGAGEPKTFDVRPIENVEDKAYFFPDGKRIVVFGVTGKSDRGYILDIENGTLSPVTPPGYWGGPISPDGKWVVVRNTETSKPFLFPVAGGPPRPLVGLDNVDQPVQWSADSRALFAHEHGPDARVKVFRVDVETGHRDLWLTLASSDPAGILQSPEPILTPDGKSYVYSDIRRLDDLYLVDGLE